MKHNNQIQKIHLHKGWSRFVKTWFNQPGQKKARRIKRSQKALRNFPRPLGRLRPIVRSMTRKYNTKQRLGRGFSLQELRVAGIPKMLAPTIGIAVDYRRTDLSEEALRQNVERLREYRSKLVIFPKRKGQQKKLDASPADLEGVKQYKAAHKTVLPFSRIDDRTLRFRAISDAEKHSKGAFFALRYARSHAKHFTKWSKNLKRKAAKKRARTEKKKAKQ